MSTRAVLLAVLLAVPAAATALPLPGGSGSKLVVAVEGAESIDRPSLGYGVTLGWRGAGGFGLFLRADHALWLNFDTRSKAVPGSLQLGAGAEVVYFGGRIRSALSLGTSTLLFDTALDPAGSTGLHLDLRPAEFRLELWPGVFAARLAPLHVSVLAPVLSDLPLVMVQYRTTLTLELCL